MAELLAVFGSMTLEGAVMVAVLETEVCAKPACAHSIKADAMQMADHRDITFFTGQGLLELSFKCQSHFIETKPCTKLTTRPADTKRPHNERGLGDCTFRM